MIRIQFGRKSFRFYSSFSEFNLSTVKDYMTAYDEYDKQLQKFKDKTNLVASLPDDRVERLIELSAEIDDITMQLHSAKIEILQSVCLKDSFSYFATNTKGVDYEIINTALLHIVDRLGHFDKYWDSCPPVNSFKHKPPKSILSKHYAVHSMDSNTVIRTEMASMQLKQAFKYKNQLDAGKWNNICNFCAVITRPLLQKDELGKKDSFIKIKELKSMNHADRLAYYSKKLIASQEKLAEKYSNLPLSIAIGVIKEFWKKKNEIHEYYDQIYKSSEKVRTKQYKKYIQAFGIETTIANLAEVSNYNIDEIWLFNWSDFQREVRKYNMKANAEKKEFEALQKEFELKNKGSM